MSKKKPGKKNAKTNPRGEQSQGDTSMYAAPPLPQDETESGGASRQIVRTRKLTRQEDTTIDPDGHELTATTTHIDDIEERFPVPYQGPASDHPAPVG